MVNMDYSKSAVNLTNRTEIGDALIALREAKATLQKAEVEAENYIPAELKQAIQSFKEQISTHEAAIKQAIDQWGSYQDVTTGLYAVKQRKVSVSYDASVFETKYPQYAPAVIVKAVDAKKIDGLFKGGLLNADELKGNGVAKESESFVFIIKA